MRYKVCYKKEETYNRMKKNFPKSVHERFLLSADEYGYFSYVSAPKHVLYAICFMSNEYPLFITQCKKSV